jgi:hypothetical protein
MCAICEKIVNGEREFLIDLELHAPKYPNSYLTRCPNCHAYWMGHGFGPQIMIELSADEAAEIFPELA